MKGTVIGQPFVFPYLLKIGNKLLQWRQERTGHRDYFIHALLFLVEPSILTKELNPPTPYPSHAWQTLRSQKNSYFQTPLADEAIIQPKSEEIKKSNQKRFDIDSHDANPGESADTLKLWAL